MTPAEHVADKVSTVAVCEDLRLTEQIRAAITDARAGRTENLGDFTRHANDPEED
jgi:hypothetical protein